MPTDLNFNTQLASLANKGWVNRWLVVGEDGKLSQTNMFNALYKWYKGTTSREKVELAVVKLISENWTSEVDHTLATKLAKRVGLATTIDEIWRDFSGQRGDVFKTEFARELDGRVTLMKQLEANDQSRRVAPGELEAFEATAKEIFSPLHHQLFEEMRAGTLQKWKGDKSEIQEVRRFLCFVVGRAEEARIPDD